MPLTESRLEASEVVPPAVTPPSAKIDRDEVATQLLAVPPCQDEPIAPPRIVGNRFHVERRDETGLSFSRRAVTALAPALLTTAALALSAVGIAINGWFARSLGSSDLAGWLFLAVGVAADLVALVLPSTAAGLWQAGQRATALVGWVVWLVTFVFAVTAGVGFASTNISDVTLARSERVTSAVTSAQAALADAMAARDRECKGGVGKICREREAAVADRRRILDSAMRSVGEAADPQATAAIKLVAWITGGMIRPAPEDFAMLRLILLALLPQMGGMLLLIRRLPMPTHRSFASVLQASVRV
jgi:hypothetical protein